MVYAGEERIFTMAINYELLGKRIAALRIRCHLSQEALGETLHIGRTHIAFIETNRRRPSIDLIVDIANALHVSTDDLLLDSLEYSPQQPTRSFTDCCWNAMMQKRTSSFAMQKT